MESFMGFFKREMSPVERFESALKEKHAARLKLAARLDAAEAVLTEKRTAAAQQMFEKHEAEQAAKRAAVAGEPLQPGRPAREAW